MNKLEQGAESFKQFVQDEYNKLQEELLKVEADCSDTIKKLKKAEALLELAKIDSKQYYNRYLDLQEKYLNLEEKHKALTALYNKLIEEMMILSKTPADADLLYVLEFKEKQLLAMVASHGELVKKEIENDKEIEKLNNLIHYKNTCLVDKTKENFNQSILIKNLRRQKEEAIKLNDRIAKDYNDLSIVKDRISCNYASLLQDERLRSNGDLVNTIQVLRNANEKFIEENKNLKEIRIKLLSKNNKLVTALKELGRFINKLGYNIKYASQFNIDKADRDFIQDLLDEKEPVADGVNAIVDMLAKGLSKDYDVKVKQKVMNPDNKKRDSKGRFIKN